MFCENCGTRLLESDIQCPECGRLINRINYYPQNTPKKVNIGLGYMFAGISLFFFPIIFGPIAIALGIKANNDTQEDSGSTLLIVAIICMIVGMIFGALTAF